MSRSVKKGPFVQPRLLGRVQDMNKRNERKVLKTWSRASVIFPDFIGHTIAVYNGKTVEEATALLRFMPQAAARDIARVLKSATANAENNHSRSADELYIADAICNEGP